MFIAVIVHLPLTLNVPIILVSTLGAKNTIPMSNLNDQGRPRLFIVPVPGKKRQEDDFMVKFTEAWIGSGIHLNTLSEGPLRDFLQTAFFRKLPCVTTLATTYAD